MLDIAEIWRRIPHRYPFLLVDKVLELEEGQRVVAVKNVTINEAFFAGHYPERPIMPGVLMLEAMAQAAAVMLYPFIAKDGKLPLLAGIDRARFRRPVVPGDVLRLEARTVRLRGRAGTVSGQALVDGEPVCEADFLFAAIDGSGGQG
ncbi:3-hydroxyacyl-ACP dehydratase FabZ [Carboxydochorda subterranea]|uniref:3-hydroxyacyl-[acyl-carrier-protein] dehydratase FabZ n=1 Tax=Carboxydichorda subterranea TaxID=3109565 RepID=A0ABZ1BXU3_9FIRM|nr:3-hydroxyacyl-ACP dehydratase FabZ [Limnochorda sp. L945t]WRP16903.1 3-hydroxyacyl-ACP dehydratase FabZ [Limnochorda sp. L945t]